MKTYEIANKAYSKIITPFLDRKKLDVMNSTSQMNNASNTNNDTKNGLKDRKMPRKESHSYTLLNQFSGKDYYHQRKLNLQQSANPIQLRKQKIIENLEQFDQIDYNSHNVNYFQEKGLYYNKDYGIEEYMKIKNERDDAFKEISTLKEMNKNLSCDYTDAIMQLKDYEKMNNDLEERMIIIQNETNQLNEYKVANNQYEAMINDYQIHINKLSEQIENLSNDNLQLDNTNRLLLNDVNEAKKIINKLKSGYHHHQQQDNNNNKEERKNTALKPSNHSSSKTKISKKTDSPTEKRIISYEQAKRLQKNITNTLIGQTSSIGVSTTALLIEELEKRNNDMTMTVDDIEKQLDDFLNSNNIKSETINNNNETEVNNNNNNDIVFTIAQALCLFINEINVLLEKDQIPFAQYFNETYSLSELAYLLEEIKQLIISSFIVKKA